MRVKNKILFIIESMSGGGAELVLLNIINHLDTDHYDITLFLCRNEGIYLNDIKKEIKIKHFLPKEPTGIINRRIIYSLKKRAFNIFLKSKKIKNIILKEHYDLAIAFLEGPSSLILHHLIKPKKKIAWVHIDLKKHLTFKDKSVEEEIYSSMDSIYCVSNDAKKSFCELYPNLKNKSHVAFNPVDSKGIIDKSNEPIELECDSNDINLIAIGRIVNRQKGFDILLKAHKTNIELGYNYQLKIIGEGSDKQILLEYIKNNNLTKNTKMLGYIKNPYPYLNKSDVFVMSSHYEGYPLALVEALTLGKAIIATNCTGPKEALDNGKYGLLVEPGNVEQLAAAIRELVNNPEKIKHYQKLSLIRAEVFDFNKNMNRIEEIIKNHVER